MKLLAPCSDPSEVDALLRAGADELYCGVYDRGWAERWGLAGGWPNRRGPGPGNLASIDALAQVCEAAHAGNVGVQLTLNASYYAHEQEAAVLRLAADAAKVGIDGLVIGTPALLRPLRRRHPEITLVASSLCAARNSCAVRLFAQLGADRVILSRQVSLVDIQAIRQWEPGVPLEAFVLNDACAFEESSCQTAHQLPGSPDPYCLSPWRPDPSELTPIQRKAVASHGELLAALAQRGFTPQTGLPLGPCGLCALADLAAAGVYAVKVVGREAHPYRKVRSVQMVRHVLDALAEGGERLSRQRALALREDPDGCRSGLHCYYPEVRPTHD